MIPDALRAEDVKRWHMVRMSRQQNLAEHSFNVAIIASAIAKEAGWPLVDIHGAAYYALLHDLDEVFTGDIPSHTKGKLRSFDFDWSQLEGHFGETPDHYKPAIKGADFSEMIRFCLEYADGTHAHAVMRWLDKEMMEFLSNLSRYDKPLADAIQKVHARIIISPNHFMPKEDEEHYESVRHA